MKIRLALAGGVAALALAACTPEQIAQYGNIKSQEQAAQLQPVAGYRYDAWLTQSGHACHVQIHRESDGGLVFDGVSADLCRADVVNGINVGDFTVTCWKVMPSGELVTFRSDARRVAQSGCDAMSSDTSVTAA